MEYIVEDIQLSDTHVMARHEESCSTCEKTWKTPHSNSFQHVRPIHVTDEPAQIFQCTVCHGGVLGKVVIGPDGDGRHSHFGAGRQIKTSLPWVEICWDFREASDDDFADMSGR